MFAIVRRSPQLGTRSLTTSHILANLIRASVEGSEVVMQTGADPRLETQVMPNMYGQMYGKGCDLEKVETQIISEAIAES